MELNVQAAYYIKHFSYIFIPWAVRDYIICLVSYGALSKHALCS